MKFNLGVWLLMIVGPLALFGCDPKSKLNSPAASDQGAASSTIGAENPRAVSPSSSADNAESPASATEEAPKKTVDKVTGAPTKPSPKQIAGWGIPEYEPLELLSCSDGFGDSAVQSVAIGPDGKQFVAGGSKLTVWNTKDSIPFVEILSRYDGSEVKRPLRSVAISPDGKWIAAGDQRGKVRLWNLTDQEEVVALQAHEGHLTQLAFSSDSHVLATTSYSGDVRLWELPAGKKLKNLKISSQEITQLVFLTDSLLAAAGSEGATIWNTESGTQETALTDKNVIGPALGLSQDHRWLAFNDSDLVLQLWDVQNSRLSGRQLKGASAHLIEFSPEGKWIATYSQDSNIDIWDAATGQLVQIINADGGRTSALKWLPDGPALLVASEIGRIRIWGRPGAALTLGIEPIPLPTLESGSPSPRQSLSSAQFQQIVDIRSLPRLPGAVPKWGDFGVCAYSAPASQTKAELFYRYLLEKSDWTEVAPTVESPGGLIFRKEGCDLNLTFAPATSFGGREGDLQVSLHFAGNYDVRWLAKIFPIESKSSWDSFSSVSYRTQADISDVEVSLLKQFHEAGWTAYSRFNEMSNEDPQTRFISMLQGGSLLNISIGHPTDSAEELFVQTSVSVSNKSLPVPPDAGWIEFDSSTDLLMVANTKLNLEQTAQFYDQRMASEGWVARESGRQFKDDKGWLPYIRGQQDVFIRLTSRPDGGTRIVVGDVESSSWQLRKPTPVESSEKSESPGIEAADFRLPDGATGTKFNIDEKKIEFEIADATPQKLGEQFVKQMDSLEWKREGTGIISDDYVFITYSKGKSEIQLRTRSEANKATAMISGDGLSWTKPLPTPPVRISYGTWLRRNHYDATLDRLEEFTKEMHAINAVGTSK